MDPYRLKPNKAQHTPGAPSASQLLKKMSKACGKEKGLEASREPLFQSTAFI